MKLPGTEVRQNNTNLQDSEAHSSDNKPTKTMNWQTADKHFKLNLFKIYTQAKHNDFDADVYAHK